MHKKEYNALVVIYGEQKAKRALRWFVENHTEKFRKSVKQTQYCVHNEYLWHGLIADLLGN